MVFQFKYETEFNDILNSNDFKEVNISLPKDVTNSMRFMLESVKEAFEQGACGALYILGSDHGIDSEEYNDLLKQNYINGEDYEYDDVICQDNDCEWHIRVFLGTDAYWTFVYYIRSTGNCDKGRIE